MHKLVSPEGVLHLLPLDDPSILSFTKAHGLKEIFDEAPSWRAR
jgi:hypothetical protein